MRILILLAFSVFLSCGQNSAGKKPVQKDTAIIAAVQKDTVTKTEQPSYTAPDEGAVNESLSKRSGDKWHVMNDREAKWIKDAFEYFIVSKRKDEPNYPYITYGDFNGDSKPDTAAVVTNEDRTEFRVALLLSGNKIEWWKDDILINAALSTVPKGTAVDGGDIDHPKKIKMKIDGINVEYFEQASFVIYQSGRSFKRIQTGD